MKILIVNDSSVLTAVIKAVVETNSKLQVVAIAKNGEEAIRMVPQYLPDIILMDIYMPVMDGVESTRRITLTHPNTRILITSATIKRNMKRIFTAMQYGAIDYVHSPKLHHTAGTAITPRELQAAGAELMQKIETILRLSDDKIKSIHNHSSSPAEKELLPPPPSLTKTKPTLLAIGCSTGGPNTVRILLSHLNNPFPAPILICQHITQDLTQGIISWLHNVTHFPVTLARQGERPTSGTVYIAPGGNLNLELTPSGTFNQVPPKPGDIYLPNINHLFHSLAKNRGTTTCATILTGMGDDGAAGIKAIHEAGGYSFTQDSESSVIDSMPNAARHALNQMSGETPLMMARRLNQLFAAN